MLKLLRETIPTIHKEGHIIILIAAAVSLLLGMFVAPLGWLGALLTAGCVYFFRDPERYTPTRDGCVVSPADGRVIAIETVDMSDSCHLGEGRYTRISIFLSVCDVHVNRIPVGGTVELLRYHPGTFVNASFDKASDDNERQWIVIQTPEGLRIGCVQIAGLIARRIVCSLDLQQSVQAGERFGIIRFGSRVDVYIPEGIAPLVAVGQRAVGGETILADLLASSHSPMTAVVRS